MEAMVEPIGRLQPWYWRWWRKITRPFRLWWYVRRETIEEAKRDAAEANHRAFKEGLADTSRWDQHCHDLKQIKQNVNAGVVAYEESLPGWNIIQTNNDGIVLKPEETCMAKTTCCGGHCKPHFNSYVPAELQHEMVEPPVVLSDYYRDEEEVRTRAYYMWVNAGRPEGQDAQFWAAAEREYANVCLFKGVH